MAATTKVFIDNTGMQCNASDLNGFEKENNNLITSVGLTLDTSNNNQTSQAVAAYSAYGDFYVDSGAANAYVLTNVLSMKPPPAYHAGMRVRFVPANSNTGAATVNVASLGNVSIVARDGTALVGSEIIAGRINEMQHNGTSFVLIDGGVDAIGVPTGTVLDFAGSTAPDGFILINTDGMTASRTAQARLFAVLGVIWGAGDGTTTFGLPPVSGRTMIGAGTGSGLTARTLAQTGGEEGHIQTVPELVGHAHSYTQPGSTIVAQAGSNSATGTAGGTTGTTGGGAAFNVMQPFTVMNKIIKT